MDHLPRLASLSVLVLLCCGAGGAHAQLSTDVPAPTPDLNETYRERTQQEAPAAPAIPPVRERQGGPRIAVKAIQFDTLPEFPDHAIRAEDIKALAEKLRRQYAHENEVGAGGFTHSELDEIGAQLDQLGGREQPDQLTPEQLTELVATLRRQKQQRGLAYADLEDIANQITRYYRERGIILAKAYIPAQDVSNGVVTFSVLEGKLDRVAVTGNKRYSEERLQQPFEDQLGKAVDSRKVEESLYLINDYPGLNTYGFFSAGSTPGSTDLNLQVRKEKPLRFTLRGDNYGSRFTGDQRMFGMLDWFNPLGIGDQLSVGYLQSRSPVNSKLGVFNYSLPVFGPRTRLSLSYDHNEFSLDESSEALRLLDINGTNTNLAVGLDHQLIRSRASNLALGISLTDKKTTLDSIIELPAGDEHVRGVELRLNADQLSDRYRLINMQMLALQYGKFAGTLAEGRDDHFYKLSLDTSSLLFVTMPLTSYDTRFLLRSKLRYSQSTLPAFEQLSLGGADGVRAFTSSDFSADTAAQLSLEWYLPFPSSWKSPLPGDQALNDVLQFGLFSDNGYGVQNSYQTDVSDKWAYLAGYGVLFKLAWSDWFSTQLSVAHPNGSKSNLDGVGDAAKSYQTFLSFTWVLQ